MWTDLSWGIAAVLLGIGLFRLIGRLPVIDRTAKYLLVVAVVLGASPFAREFLAVDECLDSGGAWSKEQLRCSHE